MEKIQLKLSIYCLWMTLKSKSETEINSLTNTARVVAGVIKMMFLQLRGGSRTAAASKMELFVIIVNGLELLFFRHPLR